MEEINPILLVGKREPTVERLVKFLVSFSTGQHLSEPNEVIQEFTDFFLKYLLELVAVREKAVRFRSCQLIAGVMAVLSKQESVEIGDGIEEVLLSKLTERLQDKFHLVRIMAAKGLAPFHDPSDPSDPVLQSLFQLLANDQTKEVRKSVMKKIGLSKYTVPDIAQRTRDIDPGIRGTAFEILREADISMFDSRTLNQLFKNGLSDPSPSVKNVCEKMLVKWYNKKNSIVEFLRYFDVTNNETSTEAVLRLLLSNIKVDPESFKEHEIDEEFSLLWRVYCFHVRSVEPWLTCEEIFSVVLPEIQKICAILDHVSENTFVVSQMLSLCLLLDFGDEAGRRALSQWLLQRLGQTANEKEIVQILEILRKMHNNDEFVRVTLEIMSDIRDPLEETPSQLGDQALWPRLLTITTYLLQHITNGMREPGITGILSNIIKPTIRSSELEVKLRGIKCLGLYCLLDPSQAREYLFFFLSHLDDDNIQISLVSMSILFDFLAYFGPKILGDTYSEEEKEPSQTASQKVKDAKQRIRNERRKKHAQRKLAMARMEDSDIEGEPEDEEEVNTKKGEIIKTLIGKLNSMDEAVRDMCTQGFCKLFMNNVVEYPSILATLIVELFHPLTSKFKRQQMCLVAFFQAYNMHPKHQLITENAFLLVVSMILDTHEGSSMAQIKLADLTAEFLPKLLPQSPDEQYDPNIHKRLAQKFLSHIVSNPLGKPPRELSPILLKLSLQLGVANYGLKTPKKGETDAQNGEDKIGLELIHECRTLVEKAQKFVTDKVARANLEKFKTKLEAIDNTPLKTSDITATPASKKPTMQKTLSNVLEEKKLYFDEMDKFELKTQVPSERRKSQSQVKLSKLEEEKNEVNQLLQALEMTAKTSTKKKKKDEDKAETEDEEEEEDPQGKQMFELIEQLKKKMEETFAKEQELLKEGERLREEKRRLNFPLKNLPAKRTTSEEKRESRKARELEERQELKRKRETESEDETTKKRRIEDEEKEPATVEFTGIELGDVNLPNLDEEKKVEKTPTKTPTKTPKTPLKTPTGPPPRTSIRRAETLLAQKEREKREALAQKKREQEEEKERKKQEKEEKKKQKEAEQKKLKEERELKRLQKLAEAEEKKKKQEALKAQKEEEKLRKELEKKRKREEQEAKEAEERPVKKRRALEEEEPKKKKAPKQNKSLLFGSTEITEKPKDKKSKLLEEEKKKEEEERKKEEEEKKKEEEEAVSSESESTATPSRKSSRTHKTPPTQVVTYSQVSQDTPPRTQTKKKASQKAKNQEEEATPPGTVVAFTGFVPTSKKYNLKMRAQLAKSVQNLGGNVEWGDTFHSTITHVIAPPDCRTMKTLIARLTGRWLVTPEWILQSAKSKKFLDEGKYGSRITVPTFQDKTVFISEDFRKENASNHFHEENFKTLIETLGKGRIVKSAFGADIVLIPALSAHNFGKLTATCLTWKEFFNHIQPISDDQSQR
eukprot:TRINITY_DN8624_c0_g3_i1.p1 TRINITY_DN8624_c0_g3~~TRINITY_DN8624_c0_g3_i1.p1  ORF type:complete len:1511 (-),score=427.56 TRINITY_DN8624_c0_g3_i1:47-4435(-)